MPKSISVRQKKRGPGRPPTGIRPIISIRLSQAEIGRLDRWAKAKGLSRSEAIRVLIDRGLGKQL